MDARFAEVVFDRPLDQAYSYAIPEGLTLQVGQRVECPFGRGDRATEGFVVGLTDQAPNFKTKPISRALDAAPLVDDLLLKLTRWLADYYLCGWGQVLHAVVPAGVRAQSGTRAVHYVELAAELPDPLPSLTPKQRQAFDKLSQSEAAIPLANLARDLGGAGSILALVQKGLVRKFSERVESETSPSADDSEIRTAANFLPVELNSDQLAAWKVIECAVMEGIYKPILLYGVTGSGKTELYLRAIDEVVKQGKEAIVLVPEISLTPQTIERFAGRGGTVAVLHSHLTNAARGRFWRRIAAGEVHVVVGARSAVFAPTRKLGLIVIDEEHETTFKQDSTPRYHGRDVAVMRARLENIPILLGSATPSLESWHNAHRPGGYTLLNLPKRVEDRPMPAVALIDQRHEFKTAGKQGPIGPTLDKAMHDALDAGGQVILLLNRRGFNTHVHCPACGYVAQCAHCDLSLTFHRARHALVCHYCGWETPPYHQCPACGTAQVKFQGLGTEKLLDDVESRFPKFTIARMDSDTMLRPGDHRRTLDDFKEGRTHILLGTQMIAKGLDFPNVTLVGVVNADVGLHLPDFRAAERTFQLLAQVAGRTGRGEKGGRVLIQTFNPHHPAIALAAEHDFLTFAEGELTNRRSHQYPPYQRLARLVIRSEKEQPAADFADRLHGAFQAALNRPSKNPDPVRLLGPAECPVFRLNGYYRFHFQVQSANSKRLHEVLREALTVLKPPHGVEWQVDVDPHNML